MKHKIFLVLSIFLFNLAAVAAKEELKMNSNAQKIVHFFQALDKDNMKLISEFYDPEVVFQDPVHKLHGAKAVEEYYLGMYKNVESIRFEFVQTISQEPTHVAVWRMHLKTPKLNSGEEFVVDGNSVITFGGKEGKVVYHRDFFDMGEFVYERIPVIKSVIKVIKNKLSGN